MKRKTSATLEPLENIIKNPRIRCMKKWIRIFLTMLFVLGTAGCSQDNGEQAQADHAESVVSEMETEAFDPARMLSEDSKAVCGVYLKAGDPTYQLEVKPGGRLNRNQLTFTVKKSLKENAAREPIRYLELLSDFKHKDLKYYDTDSTANGINIEWNDEECYIEFLGDTSDEAAGRYYPAFYYFYPEAFFRPLNRADIIGMTQKDIRLLRNQFYAAHGRRFKDEELQEYFEKRRWYVAEEGEAESEFTNLEERNIEFLGSIERELSRSEPSTIGDAGELFTIYDDENVLLPGEVELLSSYSIEPFTKEGLQVLNAAKSKTAFELSYFKPVYEGDIYVLKGAQEEYINYFPLIPSDECKGVPGTLRDIEPEEGHDTSFSGNLPAFDCNGYLRGLYFAGD